MAQTLFPTSFNSNPPLSPSLPPRRWEELVRPDPPQRVADAASLVLPQQEVVMFNVAGPVGFSPQRKEGLAVRLLACVAEPVDRWSGRPESLHWAHTHAPVALFHVAERMRSPEECEARLALLTRAYTAYLGYVDAEFEVRLAGGEGRGVEGEEGEEEVKGGEEEGKEGKEALQPEDKGLEEPPEPAVASDSYFVVSVIPHVLEGGVKDYSEPLLSVFGSFPTHEKAKNYGVRIAEDNYSGLELVVVEGGRWFMVEQFGQLDQVESVFPNVASLERLSQQPSASPFGEE